MIKLECTSVMNFENALRGMRNPMQSYDKADSIFDCPDCASCPGVEDKARCVNKLIAEGCMCIGANDLDLARRLAKAGSDERKFLRQIFVSVDVTAPLYWWKEYDTYKVGTVANSTSTMHKIHAKEFSLDDFSHERMSERAKTALSRAVWVLELCRRDYVETKDKQYWDDMIQLLPSSYNQMRTCTLNYENLINIYYARKAHRLSEWREYCKWIETLPYAKELLCDVG